MRKQDIETVLQLPYLIVLSPLHSIKPTVLGFIAYLALLFLWLSPSFLRLHPLFAIMPLWLIVGVVTREWQNRQWRLRAARGA